MTMGEQHSTLLQDDQTSARPARLPTWVSTRVICQVIGISRATLYRNLQQGVFRMGIECRRINPLAIKGQVQWHVPNIEERLRKASAEAERLRRLRQGL
ncbi:MAG: hypothetical protein KFB97_03575 [Cyanobium sp. M30B3]|jgi:hypothetical protein|nr:MAG: hypothetical protein KFB97_03575 [Cyanobium sp. M30B3]